jgi:WhiB family redox-sensing transcriptional regulator
MALDEVELRRAHTVAPEVAEAARLEVARRAENADEAKKLLAMLGLDGARPRKAKRNNRDWPSNLARKPAPPPAVPAIETVLWPEWMDDGLCAGHPDPELWFPVGTSEAVSEAAREICSWCPVIETCREYAAARGIPYGVWGGSRLDNAEPKAAQKEHGRAKSTVSA